MQNARRGQVWDEVFFIYIYIFFCVYIYYVERIVISPKGFEFSTTDMTIHNIYFFPSQLGKSLYTRMQRSLDLTQFSQCGDAQPKRVLTPGS